MPPLEIFIGANVGTKCMKTYYHLLSNLRKRLHDQITQLKVQLQDPNG